MRDIILEKFFETERWEYAIEKGVSKDICKADLISLTSPETRISMMNAMRSGKYQITPPHTAKIPKDNGEFRTVYINEPIDRVFLSIANDLLFSLMPEMIHSSCKSYQTGIGCGKVVTEVSARICNGETGWKSDLSKYFDSVPVRFIDKAFDKVEEKYGHSAVIDVLRKYYHSELYFDEDNNLQEKYQSLKQGCAVASWLANVLLFHIDKELSAYNGMYVRYSDDMLFIGSDYKKAMECLRDRLGEMELRLNPKKVEYLSPDRWFKFLGFSIKGDMISLSSTRIKTFQDEIMSVTIKKPQTSLKQAINAVNKYLYKGNGTHSWATQVLPVCNVRKDIDELNKYVMDCLRAVETGRKRIGGLGYSNLQKDGCVVRGKGKNVRSNRERTGKLHGYLTIGCMYNAIKTRRAVYNTLVRML